ncbi:MAG: DUF751 family protein, partial [Prochlorotrichaceae cyanobacterium]
VGWVSDSVTHADVGADVGFDRISGLFLMKNFFDNVFRYPRYFITFVLGIFFSLFEWVRPIIQDRTTATVLGILLVSGVVFVTLTLRAMLGLAAV